MMMYSYTTQMQMQMLMHNKMVLFCAPYVTWYDSILIWENIDDI